MISSSSVWSSFLCPLPHELYLSQRVRKCLRSSWEGVARLAHGPASVRDAVGFELSYTDPNTEAHLNPQNCLTILYEYVRLVLRKNVEIFEDTDTGMVCRYPKPSGFAIVDSACPDPEGPSFSDFLAPVQQDGWSHRSLQQRWLAFLAVRRLIREGFIGENNMPTPRALETDPNSDFFGGRVYERTSTPPEDPVPVEPSHTVQPVAGRAVGNEHSELQTHLTNPKSFLNDTLSGVLRPHM